MLEDGQGMARPIEQRLLFLNPKQNTRHIINEKGDAALSLFQILSLIPETVSNSIGMKTGES